MRRVGLVAAALLGLVAVEPATAKSQPLLPTSLPAASDSLLQSGPAEPTLAWLMFCEQLAQECTVDASEPSVVRLSQDIWSSLVEVNERVNRTILPVTDRDHWGVVDRWDYPDDGLGDCEDIQLLKRKLLIEAGLVRRALRMTVVVDEQGEGHAVLMARTDHGDFILDNKRDAVLAWQQSGYRYVKREGDDSAAWAWLGDRIAPIVTANR
ncbi:transglutaminase-like cysteine peptidase [Microvirga aerophila]|nr:transglutaminase-like cysteine peptidase [Microvirga aerophila]